MGDTPPLHLAALPFARDVGICMPRISRGNATAKADKEKPTMSSTVNATTALGRLKLSSKQITPARLKGRNQIVEH